MILERFRRRERRVYERNALAVLRLGLLDAALDLANVLQVVAQPEPIGGTEAGVQRARITHDGIEDAPVHEHPGTPLGSRAPIAEQSFEGCPRVDLPHSDTTNLVASTRPG